MRLRRRRSPATTLTFPKAVYTAEELLAQRALETKLRVDAKMRKYR